MYISSVNLCCYIQNLLCRQKISFPICTYTYICVDITYVCIYMYIKANFFFQNNNLNNLVEESLLVQAYLENIKNIRKENSTVRTLLQRKTFSNTHSIIKNKPCIILSLCALSWFLSHPFFNFPMQLLLYAAYYL